MQPIMLSEKIADRFIIEMKKQLTPSQLKQVDEWNLTDAYSGNCCASHDFCDPNDLMAKAFETCGIEHDCGNSDHANLWNAAWDLAKNQGFAPIRYSNPRNKAIVKDWPSGRRRVTATFELESNKRGVRVNRTTTGKPKSTTYYERMAIVDGDDGRVYLLGLSKYGQHIRIEGTLKVHDSFYDGPEFDAIGEAFDQKVYNETANFLSQQKEASKSARHTRAFTEHDELQ